jgi:DNA-binding CsgD family transcriptional regulator
MREDEMLKVAVRCASDIVHGVDIAPVLAESTRVLLRSDAGAAVVVFPVRDRDARHASVTVSGCPEFPLSTLPAALDALGSHPTLRTLALGRSRPVRLSDVVDVHSFRDTDAWGYFHRPVNGKYAADCPLGIHRGRAHFLGTQRTARDFDAEDMAVLDASREPMTAALAFRAALDRAAARLRSVVPDQAADPAARLTSREADVLALVARGWTNQHAGHTLGITERTVRKHLSSAYLKLGVSSRAAAAATWAHSLAAGRPDST